MIKNYFKVAWRNIMRHKVYSAINILGLSIGIATCLIILQYVSFQLSYENFQVNKNQVYRVQQDRYDNGKLSTQWAAGAFGVGNAFKDAIPEVEDYVKLVQNGKVTTDVQHQPLKIEKVFFASASFFKIFTYPLIAGDKNTALKEPFDAAVSETTAKKVFGTTNVIGKQLELNRNSNYVITAVYKDAPGNTQIKPDVLLSYATFVKWNTDSSGKGPETAWEWDGCLTYLQLRKGADPAAVEKKFPPIVDKFVGADMKKYNSAVTYHLQPLNDIHLYSHYMMEPGETSDGKTVYLLLGIAFFIVVIAWVNYINLATARAITRAKEVGVRKAIGSQRRQLVLQFLTESALINGAALAIALLIVLLAIPGFNKLSGQELSLSLFMTGNFWIDLSALFFVGIFFSGLYPAFVLSGFKPIEVLKGKMSGTRQSAWLRKSLVVFQFAASLFLLIGTVIVYKQIQFMRKQSLGVNIDQTLVISPPTVGTDSTFLQKKTAFKDALRQQTSVKDIAVSTNVPGEAVGWNAGGIKLVGQDESKQKQYRVIGIDYDYMQTYGLKLIAGRTFSKDFGSDDSAIMFTRKAVDLLGFDNLEDALNKRIDFWGRRYTIIGVTENFHQQSLHENYDALIFRLIPDVNGPVSIKTDAAKAKTVINVARAEWNKFFPGNTFEYFFLDDHFNDQYKADQRFGQVFTLFTFLAILIACLGLFGLASFTTLQRTKEIGIRKVLGASVGTILNLLYREFIYLLIVAFLIATPLAWLMTSDWLQGYAFRIDLRWTYFIFPFALIVGIAFIAVGFQSVKAAVANPVKSLRTE
ncbi:FtsX-like permease family protein [Ginsengibacter hankyongi]|uniref:FtsX-like permease family protein n=1 Tax=Ginsengibacter hankyongi TaxID=2607284 RepID=A0A5J5IBG9_9BACT|nr:ABC transporter permease [Ginsengibacter hankyongi]KAA9035537.1 FtsX-like permease family protein [Ginsengibacter hankyongi]